MHVERKWQATASFAPGPDLVHAFTGAKEYALGALASGIPTLVTVRDWMPTVLWLMEGRWLAVIGRDAR